jgi:copper transport protein
MRRTNRLGHRIVAVSVVAAALWLLLPGPAASAHATLLGSTPPAGYAVPTAPTELTLDFDEPVSITATPLILTGATGPQPALGRVGLSLGGRRLSAPVSGHLADGGYRLHWEVTAEDGDLVSGIITFAVGTAAPIPAGGVVSGDAIDSPLVIVLRWALFSGLFLALGGLAGDVLARRVAREASTDDTEPLTPRPLLLAGATLGTLAAIGLALNQSGLALTASPAGLVLLVEVAGFALAAVLAIVARTLPRITGVASVPLLAVVVAEGMRAHPHADSPVLGTALTIVHLLAAGVWVGALVQVLRVARTWRSRAGWTRLLVYDYARLALVLLALVVATGTAEALIVLPSLVSLVDTFYGLVLLVKIVLVGAVIVLAAAGRRRLGRSRRNRTVHPLGRSARGEVAILTGVLVVTSVLVSVAPARPVSNDLAAPPPVTGVVVPAGTLAGQVTVIATASSGRLVVRMSTPDRDDLGTDNADTPTAGTAPPYQLAASVTANAASQRALTLRGLLHHARRLGRRDQRRPAEYRRATLAWRRRRPGHPVALPRRPRRTGPGAHGDARGGAHRRARGCHQRLRRLPRRGVGASAQWHGVPRHRALRQRRHHARCARHHRVRYGARVRLPPGTGGPAVRRCRRPHPARGVRHPQPPDHPHLRVSGVTSHGWLLRASASPIRRAPSGNAPGFGPE